MEDWYRDALTAGVRDNIRRTDRCLDDLELLRAQVSRRAVALLSGDAGDGVPPPRTKAAYRLSQQLAVLREALLNEAENAGRRYRLLSPSEPQMACCDEETRRLLADLAAHFALLKGRDIPDCLAVLDRLSSRLTVGAVQDNNTEKEVCSGTIRKVG